MPAAAAPGDPLRLLSLRADTLLASAALNCAALAVPVLLLQLYDRIIPNAAFGTLAAMLGGVAAAVLVEAGLRQARATIAGWVAAQEEHALSGAALRRVLRADPRAAPSPGVQADALAAIGEWRGHRSGDLAFALADLPFAALYLGFLAWLSPLLAGAALLGALPGLAAAIAFGPAAARAIADRSASEASRHGLTLEAIAAIEPLKAMGAEAAMLRRHERLVAAAAAAGRRTAIAVQLCAALAMGAGQMVVAAVALAGAWLAMRDQLSAGALAAAILLASRGIEPLARLASVTPTLARARVARRRVATLLAMPAIAAGTEPARPIGRIALRGFALPDPRGGELVAPFDLDLARGECLALSGAGGTGKTRLLATLAGLLPPAPGTLLFDGVPVERLDPATLAPQIAWLGQRPALVPGRVMDNLTRFDPRHEAQARLLAAELGLDTFFDRHPLGYALEVGRGGSQDLPPSIVERIAAVRALVGAPRLILFDDAAGAQDQAGEARMRALLARLRPQAAMVIVAAQPGWHALADRRLVIAEGRLAERAT
jgi:ABC-type bacteriocin/lantibiotic exporter with double-glycine peptidase domain